MFLLQVCDDLHRELKKTIFALVVCFDFINVNEFLDIKFEKKILKKIAAFRIHNFHTKTIYAPFTRFRLC